MLQHFENNSDIDPEYPQVPAQVGALALAPEIVEEPFEYKLLVGHDVTGGRFKTDAQLRMDYLQRSDDLIMQMTDGVEVIDPITQERSVQVPDDVVFLDKSARPLAWMVREMWDGYAPAPGEEAPDMPDMYFANIDRNQWVNAVDPYGIGEVNVDLLDDSIIRSLRSIYVEPKHKRVQEDGTGGLGPNIDEAPAELDDKTVLIVDEVNSTGRTLKIAERLYAKAFPTARIGTTHWMGGVKALNGAIANADRPVWYMDSNKKKRGENGRGIGNRNPSYAEQSDNITQKLGGWFLGTPLPKVELPDPTSEDPKHTKSILDPLSTQLRDEIKHLVHDEDVLRLPSLQRDDFDDRIVALNNSDFGVEEPWKRDLDMDDITTWKRKIDKEAKEAQDKYR